MCGILGGNQGKWNYDAGVKALHHRGPDMSRVCSSKNFTMAFARLSIIDLTEAGMQPLTSEDGQVSMVFNGEIYGFERIRKKLEKKYTFRSSTDSEVLLKLYVEYGDSFIEHIDGMFAIAFLDKRENKVKLFRDRVGIKPLYYYYDGYDFAFASEIKAITELINKNLYLDYTALYDYLTYGYVPAPKSMYKNIRQLKPAHKLFFDLRNHKVSEQIQYWEVKVNTEAGNDIEDKYSILKVREIIGKSVKDQLVADVPVGTFLSGGVDSSVVTYECFRQNSEIESFSIGFEEKRYDESEYYNAFIDKFHNNSNVKIFEKRHLTDKYRCLKEWYGEPFADTSAFPTYLVSECARKKVKVALTGDGGDELFGGYAWYDFDYKAGTFFDSSLISRLYEELICSTDYVLKSDILDDHLLELIQKYCTGHGYGVRSEKKSAGKKWNIPKDYDDYWFLRENYIKDIPLRTRLQYLDFKTYLPGILTKVDRASMQVSLEARVPLLSRELIEFVFSLPQGSRSPNGEMKFLLRKAYPEIPYKILYRKKQGFCMPHRYLGHDPLPFKKILRDVWGIRS